MHTSSRFCNGFLLSWPVMFFSLQLSWTPKSNPRLCTTTAFPPTSLDLDIAMTLDLLPIHLNSESSLDSGTSNCNLSLWLCFPFPCPLLLHEPTWYAFPDSWLFLWVLYPRLRRALLCIVDWSSTKRPKFRFLMASPNLITFTVPEVL